ARLLQILSFSDLKVIHLERNLMSVANSWKKKVLLPEYRNKEVFMPVKSNSLIVKSWLKIRWKGRKLQNHSPYLFITYEQLIAHPIKVLSLLQEFLDVSFDMQDLRVHPSHAIGGNPMRSHLDSRIEIRGDNEDKNHLSSLERFTFPIIDRLSKIFFR
ncbi:MAG: sulfotransferase domain-containing protein, partial [Bacteroidota bacterium]